MRLPADVLVRLAQYLSRATAVLRWLTVALSHWAMVVLELMSWLGTGHSAALFDGMALAFAGGDNEGRFFNSTEKLSLTMTV